MTKVVLLCGSPRSKSNTMDILDVCANEIEKNDVDTEILSLRGKKIESCIACNKCIEEGKCVLNDGLNEIIDEIREANGFIPATPVYFGTARGDMMSALQRIGKVSRGTDEFLSWMVGGPIVVGRRGGHSLTLQEMNMFFAINEMIMVGSRYWNIVFGKESGKAKEDIEGVETIQLFGENVAKLINKIKS